MRLSAARSEHRWYTCLPYGRTSSGMALAESTGEPAGLTVAGIAGDLGGLAGAALLPLGMVSSGTCSECHDFSLCRLRHGVHPFLLYAFADRCSPPCLEPQARAHSAVSLQTSHCCS